MTHSTAVTGLLTYSSFVAYPGPNFLVTVKNSLGSSRMAGILTALGVASGTAFSIAGGMFGLTWVISSVPILFNFIRWVGGFYFLFLGVAIILDARCPNGDQILRQGVRTSPWARGNPLLVGLLTCLSNPKSALFNVGLFSAGITPQADRSIGLLMGCGMIVFSMSWYTSLAIVVSHPKVQNKLLDVFRPLKEILGGTLIALGIKLVSNPNLA